MLSFLKLVPDFIKIPVAIAIGAAMMYHPAKWLGASQQAAKQETAALRETVEVLRERNMVDAQIPSLTDDSLCRLMGLSAKDTAECMRRMAQADTNTLDLGGDHSDGSNVCRPGGGTQQVRG